MTARRLLVCLMSFGLFIIACGDDGDTGASGVSQNKPANEASASEVSRVCKTVMQMQSIEQECTSWASQDSDATDECEEKRDNCITSEQERDRSDACDGDDVMEDLAKCEGITIGDIEGCFIDYIAMQNALSCDEPVGEEVSPPECLREIVEKCPGFMDDSGDGDSSSDGGSSSTSVTCEEDDISADDVDCEALCGPLAAAGCGPTMNECNFVCEEAKTACPTMLTRIDGCVAFEDVSWVCDEDNELDLEGGCLPELVCFGQCVDQITGD